MDIDVVYIARFPFDEYCTQFKIPDFTSLITQKEWVWNGEEDNNAADRYVSG